MKTYDVIILGCGASGLFAAANALKNNRSVAIIDMGNAPARKVAVSGGGRCNFTNLSADATHYFGKNPNFIRGALARFSPTDMLTWAKDHKIKITEKAAGQYFCADGAKAVVMALVSDAHDADIFYDTAVIGATKQNNIFNIQTTNGNFTAHNLIVATGGTSFDSMGVSDIGHKIAKSFGHKIVPIRPALCAIATKVFPSDFMGISLPVSITIGRQTIYDDMLFTHFGIGGPAAYRASVRDIEDNIIINLCPGIDIYEYLRMAKHNDGKKTLSSVLAQKLPTRVAKWFCGGIDTRIADLRDTDLKNIAKSISHTEIPATDIKYHSLSSAEVVRGGVDTADVSSKTMESKLCSGLYFIGEVLDIAGDLGGFNLQWAWSSGFVAGNAI
ncbi:MAG: aminoacetone oxidase family FAD-binding enzyme [Alphaproteobacteria bacterium]|nr:aminoacetone oxidase family FAD-binding enzyme [Alphaproteobacteria bacterium]